MQALIESCSQICLKLPNVQFHSEISIWGVVDCGSTRSLQRRLPLSAHTQPDVCGDLPYPCQSYVSVLHIVSIFWIGAYLLCYMILLCRANFFPRGCVKVNQADSQDSRNLSEGKVTHLMLQYVKI